MSFIITLLFATTSCSSGEPAITEPGGSLSSDAGKTLIAYFSWGGNTRTVAKHIHDFIGGDIVEVETVVPYPDTYEEVTQIAPGELESDYRPKLKTTVENMDEYGTLIVGTPYLGRASYPGHEELSSRLQSVGEVHSTLLYAWWQWYGPKRVRYPFGMPQLDITRQFGCVWKPG